VKGIATIPSPRDIHLYFNQLYSSTLGFLCYAVSTAGTSTAMRQSIVCLDTPNFCGRGREKGKELEAVASPGFGARGAGRGAEG